MKLMLIPVFIENKECPTGYTSSLNRLDECLSSLEVIKKLRAKNDPCLNKACLPLKPNNYL